MSDQRFCLLCGEDLDECQCDTGPLPVGSELEEYDSPERGAGCLFPGKCCMPGEHDKSECHTAEMMEEYLDQENRERQ